MSQLVFLHGPGAGACADAYDFQTRHFPGSVAPNLPGHLYGTHCHSIERFTEWVRGWLWAQGMTKDLVLVGYTLGASIALQYALDYPEEVKGLVLTSIESKPRENQAAFQVRQQMRLKAASGEPTTYQEWIEFQQHHLLWVQSPLREQLVEWHRKTGPMAQYQSLVAYSQFNVHARLPELKPQLLLIRGDDDPGDAPQGEQAIHEMVPGSRIVRLKNAGHFPATERPGEVNALIAEFVGSL